jgi:hypothetical protein
MAAADASQDGKERTPPRSISPEVIAELQARHPTVDVALVARKCVAKARAKDPAAVLPAWVAEAEAKGTDQREAPAAPVACPVCGLHGARTGNGKAYCTSPDHAGGLKPDEGWFVHAAQGSCECGRMHTAGVRS